MADKAVDPIVEVRVVQRQDIMRRLDLLLARAQTSNWTPHEHVAQLHDIADTLKYTAPEAVRQEHLDVICSLLTKLRPSMSEADSSYTKEIIEAPIAKPKRMKPAK